MGVDREEDVAVLSRAEEDAVMRGLCMDEATDFGRRLPATEDIMIKDWWYSYGRTGEPLLRGLDSLVRNDKPYKSCRHGREGSILVY